MSPPSDHQPDHGRSGVVDVVDPGEHRRWLLRAAAQRAQLRARVLRDGQGVLHIEQWHALRRLFAVRRVQHTPAGPRPSHTFAGTHPEGRRSPGTSRTTDLGDGSSRSVATWS